MSDIHAVLKERGKTHGDYTDHARVTQNLKAIMETAPNWRNLTVEQRETLAMIAHKVGRILVGNPDHADHWVDIVGYTQLVIDRLPVQGELFKPGTPEDGGHHARHQKD